MDNENIKFFLDLFVQDLEVSFNIITLRRTFIRKTNGKIICSVFIPVSDQGNIFDKDLKISDITFEDILTHRTFIEFGYNVYDGGQIIISQIEKKDTPISPDIYNKLGNILYKIIKFDM